MSDHRTGIGIIGLGMASTPHAKSLQALADRADVRAAWSPTVARRRSFHERFDLPVVDTVEELIDDDRIRAVLLITPPNAREDLVRRLADRGKHILMEKPIERSSAAAAGLVDYCEQAGVKLAIVFQYRFRKAAQALKARVDSGALGELQVVQVSVPWWRQQSYYDEPGRGTYARDGGGVLISQAIHSLDLMLSMTGPVSEVRSISGTTALHRMESEDFVGAGLRFENGAMGSLMATTALYPGSTEYMILGGTLGCARLTPGQLSIRYLDGREEVIGETAGSGGGADPMDFPFDWHKLLIEDFLDAIEQDREPVTRARDVLGVHQLIDRLLSSD